MAWTDLKCPHAGHLFKIVFYLDPFPVLLRGWGHGLNIHKSTINKKAYVSVLITLTVRSFLTFSKTLYNSYRKPDRFTFSSKHLNGNSNDIH